MTRTIFGTALVFGLHSGGPPSARSGHGFSGHRRVTTASGYARSPPFSCHGVGAATEVKIKDGGRRLAPPSPRPKREGGCVGGVADDRHLKGPVTRRERRATLEPGWSETPSLCFSSRTLVKSHYCSGLMRAGDGGLTFLSLTTQRIKRRIERHEDIATGRGVCLSSFLHKFIQTPSAGAFLSFVNGNLFSLGLQLIVRDV